MGKTSLNAIFAHPIIEAMNPYVHNFTAVRWLSNDLNPYSAIQIGAGIAFMNNISHLKEVVAFGMMKEDYQNGRYNGIDTLVVPSINDNIAQATAILAPAFGIERVQSVAPGEKASRPMRGSLFFDQYSHPGNAHIHEECTGPQLLRSAGTIGMIVVVLDSGGTAIGLSRYLKTACTDTIVLGVRPGRNESIPGAQNAEQMKRSGTLPYEPMIDEIVEVGFGEAIFGMHKISKKVYPNPGLSSGMAYMGMMKCLRLSPDMREVLFGRRVIFVCPDRSPPRL